MYKKAKAVVYGICPLKLMYFKNTWFSGSSDLTFLIQQPCAIHREKGIAKAFEHDLAMLDKFKKEFYEKCLNNKDLCVMEMVKAPPWWSRIDYTMSFHLCFISSPANTCAFECFYTQFSLSEMELLLYINVFRAKI